MKKQDFESLSLKDQEKSLEEYLHILNECEIFLKEQGRLNPTPLNLKSLRASLNKIKLKRKVEEI